MAYKKQSDPDLISDIHSRKEFAQLWVPPSLPAQPSASAANEDTADNEMAPSSAEMADFRGLMSSAEMQTHQQFVRNFMNPNTPNTRMHLMHSTGCHAPGTLIKLASGSLVKVENIRVGDRLIHPTARTTIVTALHHGESDMYRIIPADKNRYSYVVNKDHILHLYEDRQKLIYDISVAEHKIICEQRRESDHWFQYYQCDGQIIKIPFITERVGYGPYYGFEVSATDGLFVGFDGLILHNSGKTRAAIATAQEYIKMFRFIYRDVNWRDMASSSPSVFIIAFGGKQAFFWDLIKYPEFGYVTATEYEELMRLYRESIENEDAFKKYSALWSSFKRRATNRSKGGFYKVYGYDEFVNRIFGVDVAKLNMIIQESHSRHEQYSVILERAIEKGEIKIDMTILRQLENSLLIADEIHNTYNTQTINNRGLTLQYVLDHVNGLRFLSLSATPINGVPAEICDFMNYFAPANDKVMRESLFSGHTLLPGAIDKINEVLRGRISFLYDFDPRYFPIRIDQGISVTVGDMALPYLRFTPCVMSEFFTGTIRKFYQLGHGEEPAEEKGTIVAEEDVIPSVDIDDNIIGIPQNAYSLFDMVFPAPGSDGAIAGAAPTGLYNSATLFGTIHSASASWKTQAGIITKTIGPLHTFGGSFLQLGQLEKYSSKYAQLVHLIFQIIRNNGPCKIMVYHERVRMTGVLLIREILRENGVLDENDEATDKTICAICAQTRIQHKGGSSSGSKEQNAVSVAASAAAGYHDFRPLRLATLYSELDKGTINSIRERYNSAANSHGEWCSILIGSRIIRESYDFNAVRFLIVLSLPVSISQLIQVFGRCVRRMSHMRLPPAERNVNVYILINVAQIDDKGRITDLNNSPEAHRYAVKLHSYLTVQKIEREMARIAIDSGINRNIITRPVKDSLGFLLYEEAVRFKLPTKLGDLHVDTFFAYGYGNQEIQFVVGIIKRLFHYQNTWRGADLTAAIRAPPFGVWSNPALISESSILIALSFLISVTGNMVGLNDRAIIINGVPHIIVTSTDTRKEASKKSESVLTNDDYLFLAPIETIEVAGITKSRALVDIESFIRGPHHEGEDIIPIDQFELQASFEEGILAILREKFKPSLATAARDKIPIKVLINLHSFLTQFSADQQRIVAQHFVERAELREEFAVLMRFLDALGIFVPYSYASKYRDIARRFEPDFVARVRPTDPVAYGDGTSIRLYTGAEWVSVGRSALNLHVEFDENDILVGIYKQFPYKIKFQLRESIQKLRQSRTSATGKHRDARTIERGSVCITNSRQDIEKYAQRLGIAVATIRATQTAYDLCDLIQIELLKREIKERSDPHSLVKFVYGWWNTIPSPF